MRIGVFQLDALRGETGHIRRIHVASTTIIGGDHFIGFLEYDWLVIHTVRTEEIGHIQFGRGADVYAYRCAREFLGVLDTEVLTYHESLTVIVVDAGKVEAQGGVANQCPRRVA